MGVCLLSVGNDLYSSAKEIDEALFGMYDSHAVVQQKMKTYLPDHVQPESNVGVSLLLTPTSSLRMF